MSNTLTRAGFALAVVACLANPLLAQDKDKWCKLDNNTDNDYVFSISDDLGAVGKILVRPAGESTKMTTLSSKKDTMVIKAKGHYQIYLDTSLKSLAITARFTLDMNYTDINFKKAPGTDTYITVKTNNPSASPVKLDLSSYMEPNGTFLSLD